MKTDCQIAVVPLGEFRMGVEGFGASIVVKNQLIKCLENEVVFVKPWNSSSAS